jgi:cysteinyl-tRNA synthetase
LLEKRAAARGAKDWSSSDAFRKQIEDLGWIVKDTKDGQKLTKKVS